MQHTRTITGLIKMIVLTTLTFLAFSQISCKKYLNEKRSQALAVPSSLKDLQALLDNSLMNGSSPGYLEFVADNYYLTSASWNGALFIEDRLSYIWDKDANVITNIWLSPYTAVYYANVVLDFLPKIQINESERNDFNTIKGAALFYRSFMFYQLAQLFCKPYSPSASTDPGIIVRTTPAVEAPSIRATVQQTYDQIVADLKTAAELLPLTNIISTRPNKTATYGLLARVFLSMRDYANAGIYADIALSLNKELLDYNSLAPTSSPILMDFASNPEVLFLSYEGYAPLSLLGPSHCKIDSNLFQSYDLNDKRRKVFFGSNGSTNYWQGSYVPSVAKEMIFDGIATDEMYLIRAECRARAGNKDSAMKDLNTLLSKRWVTGTFTDLTAATPTAALNQILVERRKELLFRGLRWSDLRRFNLEGANINLTRIINNTTYTLAPNDLRWVLLIPDIEITRSRIAQNPR